MFDHKIEHVKVRDLKPYQGNARTHSKRQVEQIAASIERFGFTNPVLVADDLTILAGHGRVQAAKLLKLKTVPVLRLSHLSETERRAYVLADNRLAENAGWDRETLAIEISALAELDCDMTAIGFEAADIDIILDDAADADPDGPEEAEDEVPETPKKPITRLGDLWHLGRHKLICGDACDSAAYKTLMGREEADVMFTDPPYNVPIEAFVSGKDKKKHKDFAMGVGEMTAEEFQTFLRTSLGASAGYCRDGAVAFVCMDWRHVTELALAGQEAIGPMLNVCVWTKTNGGMGSLYRSQHELVFVFRRGEEAHTNNVELGRHGRNRTNVWSYAGANAFSKGRDSELAMHPTVKPVALVQDALKDVSNRGDIVLDPFGGSGSTLIAAERCGRSARLIEIDPAYCDVIVKRFEAYTGKTARRETLTRKRAA